MLSIHALIHTLLHTLLHAHACYPVSHAPQVPLGEDHTKWVACKIVVDLVRVSTDFKAKTLLGPTPRSTSSWHYCPDCDYDRRSPDYDKPFSFLRGSRKCQTRWKLRTTQRTLADIDKAFKKKSAKKREKYLRAHGLRPTLQSVQPQLTQHSSLTACHAPTLLLSTTHV